MAEEGREKWDEVTSINLYYTPSSTISPSNHHAVARVAVHATRSTLQQPESCSHERYALAPVLGAAVG
eukprot:scaffold19371_cov57-Phaeocystis_antarctica.AAC.2